MHNLSDVLANAKGVKTPFSFRSFPTEKVASRLECFSPLTITLPTYIERPNIPTITNFKLGKLQATALDMEGAFMRSNIKNTTSCHRIDRVYADYGGNALYATHKAFVTVLVTTGDWDNQDYYNLSELCDRDSEDDDFDPTTVFSDLHPTQVVQGNPVFVFNMVLGYTDLPMGGVAPTVLLFRPYGDVATQQNQTFFWMYVAHLQSHGLKVALLHSDAEWTFQIFRQLKDYGSNRVQFASIYGTAYKFNEIDATPRFYPDGNLDLYEQGANSWILAPVTIIPDLLPGQNRYLGIPTTSRVSNLRDSFVYSKAVTFGRASLSHGRNDRLYLTHSKYLYKNMKASVILEDGLVLAHMGQIDKLKFDKSGWTHLELYVYGMLKHHCLDKHTEPRILLLLPKGGLNSYDYSNVAQRSLKRDTYKTWGEFVKDCTTVWVKSCTVANINPDLVKPELKKKPVVEDSFPFPSRTTKYDDAIKAKAKAKRRSYANGEMVAPDLTIHTPIYEEILDAFARVPQDEVLL